MLEKKNESCFKPLEGRLDERFKSINDRFNSVEEDLKEIRGNVSSIKDRLSRLEGRFDERGYWESRRTGTHDAEQ